MGRRNTTRHASVVGAAHGYPSIRNGLTTLDIAISRLSPAPATSALGGSESRILTCPLYIDLPGDARCLWESTSLGSPLASDVLEDDILDYLFFRSDGTSEGNETARLHRER
jgi:hypothetical protein